MARAVLERAVNDDEGPVQMHFSTVAVWESRQK